MHRNKLFSITLCFCALVFVLVGCAKNDPLVSWSIYKGEVNGFTVIIDESRRASDPAGTMERIVHITDPRYSYVGITGHDYNGDGSWDRIFRCGYPNPRNGCNAVVLGWNGPRIWEPCPADKDRVKPFTDQEVINAAAKLYEVMSLVHNAEHLVQTLENDRKEAEQS